MQTIAQENELSDLIANTSSKNSCFKRLTVTCGKRNFKVAKHDGSSNIANC